MPRGFLQRIRHRSRSVAKTITFSAYLGVQRSLPRHLLACRSNQRVIILLYHRVNDRLRDGVTVGIKQFEHQMSYVSDNHQVVSVESLVAGTYPRDSTNPVVVVTFDDGYLDNYENALPILARYSMPAAFFVATGFINTNRPFIHDLKRLGHGLPNMSWDQLREMERLGFGIGSHTVDHVNLAQIPLADAHRQLVDSKHTLERELGCRDAFIAYPFGRKTDITQQVINLIKTIGYKACFSGYGGWNRPTIDPFDIRRVPINFNFSLLAFRAALQGWY